MVAQSGRSCMRPNKFRIKAAVDAAAQRDKTMRCFMAMATSSHLL